MCFRREGIRFICCLTQHFLEKKNYTGLFLAPAMVNGSTESLIVQRDLGILTILNDLNRLERNLCWAETRTLMFSKREFPPPFAEKYYLICMPDIMVICPF